MARNELVWKVKKLIVVHRSRRISAKFIRDGYGKYAHKTSLTKALLVERASELAREEAKIKRWHGYEKKRIVKGRA